MDPVRNPYSPGAGAPPPELVGRAPILERAEILLARIKAKRAEKSLLLTGLRGVGKTVLLLEIDRRAREAGYRTLLVEAHEGKRLGPLLVPGLRSILFDLNRVAGAGEKVKRGLRVLRSFLGTLSVSYQDVSLSLGVDPEQGRADTGDLEIDIPDLFIAVAEAAEERGIPVALLIDEIQYLEEKELGALIMAMHKMQQLRLPLLLVGAGLPILAGLAGESKSYAERLFAFPSIGALSEEESAMALSEPAQAAGATFESDALHRIFELTKGYPYFLQEWGYHSWNVATEDRISLEAVDGATDKVTASLDQSFFRVRFDRLTPREKQFLRAMAGLGSGPYRTGHIVQAFGARRPSDIGPLRDSLIKKGMIYSPAHGELAFSVPLFDEFMLRAMPEPNV